MWIREATKEDELQWDTFVESEGGGFHLCFNWKYFFEAINDQFIPLIIENDAFELIGILPIVKEKRLLYSKLNSDVRPGGLLLRKDLSEKERDQAIHKILDYVDTRYSRGCSRFILSENMGSATDIREEPTTVFCNSGYSFRYNSTTKLPCTFVLKLEQPFKEKVWEKLWSHNLRNKVKKAEKKGITIRHDQEFVYLKDFIRMLAANYKRHGTIPLTKKQVKVVVDKFKDKVKLYIALQDNQPILAMLFYYHSSVCVLWELGSNTKDTNHANLLMYKKVFEDASVAGYKYINFGWTGTSGLAIFKQQFKGIRVPFRTYEKKYSILRLILEYCSLALVRSWHDKAYLLKQRHVIWKKITNR